MFGGKGGSASGSGHPVASALAGVRKGLSVAWLRRIVDARVAHLGGSPFISVAQLEKHAENTAASLLYLQLEALGIRSVHADHAASHIGKAVGIATLLRATPFHASRRTFLLPSDISAKVIYLCDAAAYSVC